MSSKVIIVLVQCVLVFAAPTNLLQQLQGISQQMQLQSMMLQKNSPQMQQLSPIQQMMQRIPIEQMMQQIPIQEMVQQMNLPLLQPLEGTPQQQMLALQEQMFALQQFQALQRMGLMSSSMGMNTQPILVLYPDNEAESQVDVKTNKLKYQSPETLGDEDSEVIEAASVETETSAEIPKMKAVLLMPNSRGIIGSIISQIPFLPLEVNVPDTIAWMYNGIASIISGIGQRLPQRPQNGVTNQNEANVKSVWNRKQEKMPIVVIPLGGRNQ